MKKSKNEKFYLYKYFNLDGKVKTPNGDITRLAIVRDIILNKQIFIPSLQVLNDPFEEMVNENNDLKSSEKSLKTGVLSFTTQHDNLLMWSHYSNSHTGLVIKFSIRDEEIKNFKKVQYIQSTSEINLHDRILVKSYHWNYENEYRRSFQKSSQHIKLDSIGLRIEGVIKGTKCSSKNSQEIYDVCLAEDIGLGAVKLNPDFSCSLDDSLSSPLNKLTNGLMHSIYTEDYDDAAYEFDAEQELASYQAQDEEYENLERQAVERPEYKKLLKKKQKVIKKLSKYKVK